MESRQAFHVTMAQMVAALERGDTSGLDWQAEAIGATERRAQPVPLPLMGRG